MHSSNFDYLNAKYLGETIICHPEMEGECPWEKLGPKGWHDILLERPDFIRHAPKHLPSGFMSARQWLEVLVAHPELEAHVPSPKSLLCGGSAAVGKLWGLLLSRHPEFAKYNPWRHLRNSDWRRLLCQQPQFIDNYWRDRRRDDCKSTLTLSDKAEVVACQPSLINRFRSEEFNGSAWETILAHHPEFIDRCDLNRISPHSLGRILRRRPEWVDYCDTYSMRPDQILCVAKYFPKIMKHYDLEKFQGYGGGDTVWIEKYPGLYRYTKWNFSHSYWNALLTRLSIWMKSGRRKRVEAFAPPTDGEDSPNVAKRGASRRKTAWRVGKLKGVNLRNSIDSIMEMRFWVDRGSWASCDSISDNIKKILRQGLTCEEMMLKMSMMPEEECGMILYGLFIYDQDGLLDEMLKLDLRSIVRNVPPDVLLPLSCMYLSDTCLLSVLIEVNHAYGGKAIADFRDKDGNNIWHYLFFRSPLHDVPLDDDDDDESTLDQIIWHYLSFRPPLHEGPRDVVDDDESTLDQVCMFLTEMAGVPDAPNNMGFKCSQMKQALRDYLDGRPRRKTETKCAQRRA